ncbi:MAG: hypothetical protein M3P46_05615 [Actinomycetota bacterium]|nr:hypothetical protein [Actinomycetota bacterium]
MAQRNTFAHFLHDAGLAAWFGGSLNGAIGINGAAADVDDPRQRARVANAGWARWTPVNAVAIGAHLIGGAQLLKENKSRVATQQDVLRQTNIKMALTAAALAATAYSRVLGKKMQNAGDVPVAGGTDSLSTTPHDVQQAQKQLKILQWVIPALTAGILLSSDIHEELQRPTEVAKGTVLGLPSAIGSAVTGTVGAAGSAIRDAVH